MLKKLKEDFETGLYKCYWRENSNFEWVENENPKWNKTQEYKLELKTFRIICLCGSSKFKDDFIKVAKEESLKGNIVLTLSHFCKFDNEILSVKELQTLTTVHFQKIILSDEIIVINKDGYIGVSTKKEIEFAKSLGKTIRFLENMKTEII